MPISKIVTTKTASVNVTPEHSVTTDSSPTNSDRMPIVATESSPPAFLNSTTLLTAALYDVKRLRDRIAMRDVELDLASESKVAPNDLWFKEFNDMKRVLDTLSNDVMAEINKRFPEGSREREEHKKSYDKFVKILEDNSDDLKSLDGRAAQLSSLAPNTAAEHITQPFKPQQITSIDPRLVSEEEEPVLHTADSASVMESTASLVTNLSAKKNDLQVARERLIDVKNDIANIEDSDDIKNIVKSMRAGDKAFDAGDYAVAHVHYNAAQRGLINFNENIINSLENNFAAIKSEIEKSSNKSMVNDNEIKDISSDINERITTLKEAAETFSQDVSDKLAQVESRLTTGDDEALFAIQNPSRDFTVQQADRILNNYHGMMHDFEDSEAFTKYEAILTEGKMLEKEGNYEDAFKKYKQAEEYLVVAKREYDSIVSGIKSFENKLSPDQATNNIIQAKCRYFSDYFPVAEENFNSLFDELSAKMSGLEPRLRGGSTIPEESVSLRSDAAKVRVNRNSAEHFEAVNADRIVLYQRYQLLVDQLRNVNDQSNIDRIFIDLDNLYKGLNKLYGNFNQIDRTNLPTEMNKRTPDYYQKSYAALEHNMNELIALANELTEAFAQAESRVAHNQAAQYDTVQTLPSSSDTKMMMLMEPGETPHEKAEHALLDKWMGHFVNFKSEDYDYLTFENYKLIIEEFKGNSMLSYADNQLLSQAEDALSASKASLNELEKEFVKEQKANPILQGENGKEILKELESLKATLQEDTNNISKLKQAAQSTKVTESDQKQVLSESTSPKVDRGPSTPSS